MAYKPKFQGVKRGRTVILNQNDKAMLGTFLENFKDGQEMEIEVAKKRVLRTSGKPGELTNFNGYYFGVALKTIGDAIGEFDLDYIHYWVQMEVGNVKVMPNGAKIPLGTSEMSGGEFSEYCKRVQIWAATPGNIFVDKGLYIPDPYESIS